MHLIRIHWALLSLHLLTHGFSWYSSCIWFVCRNMLDLKRYLTWYLVISWRYFYLCLCAQSYSACFTSSVYYFNNREQCALEKRWNMGVARAHLLSASSRINDREPRGSREHRRTTNARVFYSHQRSRPATSLRPHWSKMTICGDGWVHWEVLSTHW